MDDPRATIIMNHTYQEEACEKAIEQILEIDNLTLTHLLTKTQQIAAIKFEPQFIKNIFQKHPDIVIAMIEWTLMPKFKHKNPTQALKSQFYTFHSKQFMKNNWCFYESLFLSIYQGNITFQLFLKFLDPENYDEKTVYTALGYFSEIMVPFAKYQFSGSYYLSASVDLKEAESQRCDIMQILPQPIIDKILKYCHHRPIYEFLTTALLVGLEQPKAIEISNKSVQKLFEYCQVSGIFSEFNHTGKLIEPELQLSYIQKSSNILEHISTTLSELINNIEPNQNPSSRAIIIITSFLNSKLIGYSLQELKLSRWCVKSSKNLRNFKSQDSEAPEKRPIAESLMSHSQEYKTSNQKQKQVGLFVEEIVDEDIALNFLKILNLAIEIYMKIPKEYSFTKQIGSQKMLDSSPEEQAYFQLLEQYRNQIQKILDDLPILNRIVSSYHLNAKQMSFSSGQEIKQISFLKYQYFKLLYHCLVILQQKDIETLEEKQMETQSFLSGNATNVLIVEEDSVQTPQSRIKKSFSMMCQPFMLDIERLNVIETIQRYLNENRWNNLVHHLLEKICHVIIDSRYEYVRKNIEKDRKKKLTDSFLAYLIENFTQRDYIYLDTMRFTSQGNLHSLYNITKFLAYTFKTTNQLVILLNQFEPWKKFLMTDLRKYEEKTFPKFLMPTQEDLEQISRKSAENYEAIKVDEADAIRCLIENINVSKKWPKKRNKKKISNSGIYRKSLDSGMKGQITMYQSHGCNPKHKSSIEQELTIMQQQLFIKQEQSFEEDEPPEQQDTKGQRILEKRKGHYVSKSDNRSSD